MKDSLGWYKNESFVWYKNESFVFTEWIEVFHKIQYIPQHTIITTPTLITFLIGELSHEVPVSESELSELSMTLFSFLFFYTQCFEEILTKPRVAVLSP